MKFKVIKDAFYNKALVRAGSIIDADFKKSNIPSWATPLAQEKKTDKPSEPLKTDEPTKPSEPTTPPVDDGKDREELKAELEVLKDIAIDNELFIEIDESNVVEAIETLKTKLKENGIDL